jgi:hypothetical protein
VKTVPILALASFVSLATVAVAPHARAAEEAPKEFTPRTALAFDLGQHVVGVGLQRTDSRWMSVQGVVAYYQPWTQNINFLGLSGDADKGGDLRGAIIRVRAFLHPMGDAPTGLWITPFIQGGIGWGLRNDVRIPGPVAAAGASVGYTGRITTSWLLGGGLGAQYHLAAIPDGNGPPSFSRFYPQVEIHAAYMF